MHYKKISVAEWNRQLAELRVDSRRSFGGHESDLTIYLDMSVIPGYREREAVRLGISPNEVNTVVLAQKGYSQSEPQSGLVAVV